MPNVASRQVLICVNQRLAHAKPSCAGRGSEAIAQALEQAGSRLGVAVVRLKCFGRCAEGPNVRVRGGRFFRGATLGDVEAILAEALCAGDDGIDSEG